MLGYTTPNEHHDVTRFFDAIFNNGKDIVSEGVDDLSVALSTPNSKDIDWCPQTEELTNKSDAATGSELEDNESFISAIMSKPVPSDTSTAITSFQVGKGMAKRMTKKQLRLQPEALPSKRKDKGQVKLLQFHFEKNANWSKELVEELSRNTGLTQSQVYKWNWDQRQRILEHDFKLK